MVNDEQRPFKPLGGPQTAGTSLVGRIFAAIAGMLLLAGAFVFSVFLFAALAVIGMALWGFLWWKTRDLRKQMRAQMEQMREQMGRAGAGSMQEPAPGSTVIEGEYVREVEK